MANPDTKLTRIGVFYDGNFFFHVSNFYMYHHDRRKRISVSGLHAFIRDEVAKRERTDPRYCQIVDAHYFRGRLNATDAQGRDVLYRERVFDDVLIREGVTTHYLPLSPRGEKGIDVWLALEAFEQAVNKHFDVTVLIAGDGDYLPLARKLNTVGTRVMVLAWDFKFIDSGGEEKETRTSQMLLEEVTYPVQMNQIIDDRTRRNDPLIKELFVTASVPDREPREQAGDSQGGNGGDGQVCAGVIQSVLKLKGFGFITPDQGGDNLFFHRSELLDVEFGELEVGDRVEYTLGKNDQRPCAKRVRCVKVA